MTFDAPLAIGGLLVGIVVGLTGMGGGALMTPMLVFFFNVNPLTAISSDIVASLVMKPVAAFVHHRRGTINLELVGWLCLGSVPAAFAGAWFISLVPPGEQLDELLRQGLGVALLIATAGLIIRSFLQMTKNRLPFGEGPAKVPRKAPPIVVRPIPTLLLGAGAGLMVGITSVGAGSVIIVALLLMYPALKASVLVGTDLFQAIPLVGAAAVGHFFFGSISFELTASLLIGAIPGAWIGAQLSTRAPGGIIRRVLAFLLLASGLKLVGAPVPVVIGASVGLLIFGSIAWIVIRNRVNGRRLPVASETPSPVDSADPPTQPRDP